MFCARCGLPIQSASQFCSRCGAPLPSAPPRQPIVATRSPQESVEARNRKAATRLVVGMGLLLALFSLATLNGAAEIVSLVSIAIFCLGWAAKRIGVGAKIIFCGSAVLLVLLLQAQQNNKSERLKIEATQEREHKADEAKKKDAEAFAKMTPSQHLDRAKATLKVGADAATLSLANRDIDALAGTSRAGREFKRQYSSSASNPANVAQIPLFLDTSLLSGSFQ